MFVDIETIPTLHSFETFEEDYNLCLQKCFIRKNTEFVFVKLNKSVDKLHRNISGFNNEIYKFQNP